MSSRGRSDDSELADGRNGVCRFFLLILNQIFVPNVPFPHMVSLSQTLLLEALSMLVYLSADGTARRTANR